MSRTEKNTAKACQIVHENRQLTVMSIAEQVNIDREMVREILTDDLDMRKVCAKMVPKEFTVEQNKEGSIYAKTFQRGKMTFWAMSLQVMKHGSANKIPK
jgi:energy-converting hydrogenase A subunit M